MTTLDSNFQRFHSRIALDEGRFDRIKSAHQTLRRNVEADGPLSQRLKEVFLQGSYAQSTAVRPTEGGEFDVDVVLALDLRQKDFLGFSETRGPSDTLEWVATRLRTIPAYAGKVRRKGRCVCIEYAGEFHIDVVPAHAPDGAASGVEVPNRELDRWQPSNPKGYLEWCATRNRVSDGQFTRVTKYLKWWRDHALPSTARPKSIILQTMLGGALARGFRSDAEAVAHALASMAALVPEQSIRLWGPRIMNPSLPDENLAARWDLESVSRFSEHVHRAAVRAREALEARDDARSAARWAELFREGFPA